MPRTLRRDPACASSALRRWLTFGAILLALLGALESPGAAEAGQASAGEPLFYPCTACHPIPRGSRQAELPNGFDGHEIALVGHDALGEGGEACLACHASPDSDPGKLRLVDGTLTDVIDGDLAGVCYRCHSDKHAEWEIGAHGKGLPKCTASGCHDPHSPGSIYAGAVPPFVGTGFQVQLLPDRQEFVPLPPPAPAPPVETPAWLALTTVLGMAAVAFLMGSLALERSKR